jgi:OmpA-OmpF porin, OOP family
MIKSKLLIGAAVFLLSSSALAGAPVQAPADDAGLYLNINGTNSDALGFGPGAAIGYRFNPHFRMDLSSNYWGGDGLKSLNFMGNIYYDFDFGSRFVPYIGAGIGTQVFWLKQRAPFEAVTTGSNTNLAAQGIAGLDFKVTRKIRVGLSYHILTSPGLLGGRHTQGPNNLFSLGLSFSF